MNKTQVERTRKLRESRRAAGIKQVTVYVPATRADELKAIAKQMRAEVVLI